VRGRARHVVRPRDLVVWDPSARHAGSAPRGGTWAARVMVIELPALDAALDDELGELHFPDPVVRDARLVAGFLALHRTLEAPASTLERDTALTEWLHDLAAHSPSSPRAVARRRTARDEPALRRALDHLGDSLTANPSLDELAAAAGTGRYRLTRLFRDGLGMPPHRYQIAQRVRLARRLLERGDPIASVAAATGFVDQSHFHRHFRRSLGVTPRQYVARF
jgi:AraC-like DNA-binding protein